MKRLPLIFAITLLLPILAVGQVGINEENSVTKLDIVKEGSQNMETFAKKSNSHGIYLGLGGGVSNLGGNEIGQFKTRIAYVVNQTFEFGFEGQTFQGLTNISGTESAEVTAGGFGGIHLKGIIYGNKKIHLGFPLFIGVGALAKAEGPSGDLFDCFDADFETGTAAFVIDPGFNIEFNINKFMGLEFGVNYRFSDSFYIEENSLDNLNGWMFGGTLKFGVFDFGKGNRKSKHSKMSKNDEYYNSY